MKFSYSVYKHTAPNGKVYIGITSQYPLYRWSNGNGYKHNSHFYSAILKYGWDNIKHEVLYTNLDKQTACAIERELISIYKSNNHEYGYNNSTGGEKSALGSHWKQSESHRCKISESLKGNKNCLGRVLTVQHREKISVANKGKQSWNKGKHLSGEHKSKISQSSIGKRGVNTKQVLCVDLNLIFLSAHDASIKLSVDSSSIIKCCKGKRKTVGGYTWRYTDAV